MTNILPKRPRPSATAWQPCGTYGHAEVWECGAIRVLSAVEWAAERNQIAEPQYHVSVTVGGGRAGRQAVRKVLADFLMTGAEEDNHVPNGIVRNFWLYVRASDHRTCPCKESEPAVEQVITGDDPDLFVWRDAPGEHP